MRIVATLLAALCLLPVGSAAENKTPSLKVVIGTDRPDALYACGEEATFRVSVTENGQPVTQGSVSLALTRDGGELLARKTVDLAAGRDAAIRATLDRPGFLRAQGEFGEGKQKILGWAGAGFDPQKIKATTVDPEDFDSFWKTARAQLAQMPLDVRLTKLDKQSSETVESFAISFANVDGTRAYGFLAVPRGKEGPFPAYVSVPGAGPGPFGPSTGWAAKGCLSLVMSVHAYDPGTIGKEGIEAAYRELNAKGTYSHHGKPDRRAFYFHRAILGVDRAIEWLAARPDWDRTHLVIDGSSQGGAFALIMAGLNRRITAAAANVPAMCEHAAFLDNRQPGWPNLVRGTEGDARDQVLAMSAYYDAVNFARRITCPVIVSVGFIDRTCPPSTVYAAFNEIRTPKRMFDDPLAGHQTKVGQFRDHQPKWLLGHLGLADPLPPTK